MLLYEMGKEEPRGIRLAEQGIQQIRAQVSYQLICYYSFLDQWLCG